MSRLIPASVRRIFVDPSGCFRSLARLQRLPPRLDGCPPTFRRIVCLGGAKRDASQNLAAESVTLPAWYQPLPTRNELAEPVVDVGLGGRLEELQLEGVKLGGPATQVGGRRTSGVAASLFATSQCLCLRPRNPTCDDRAIGTFEKPKTRQVPKPRN